MDSSNDVGMFLVQYGSAQDCPSGCFYSGGVGLRRGSKIGWIRVDNYEPTSTVGSTRFNFYDFDSSDTYLFSDEFQRRLKDAVDSSVYESFRDRLALDEDTPITRLREMATELATTTASFRVQLLLGNRALQADRIALTTIATLPEKEPLYGGRDVYTEARIAARGYLANLP